MTYTKVPKIKAVIFDLGNVLIDFDHRIAAQKISRFTNKTGEEIYELFFDSHLTGSFEEGKIAPLKFFSEIKDALDLKLDYISFLPIWNEIFFVSEKNHSVYHLAKSLKKNYKVALLSNINILHFEYIKKNFPVFDAFHNIITSFELGLRKPHPLIYKKAMKILGVPAEDIFYTDDRPELIQSARRLGMQAFVFNGERDLKKALQDLNININ